MGGSGGKPNTNLKLTNLCLLRKLINLVINIKFVYNYNIFSNLSLILLKIIHLPQSP